MKRVLKVIHIQLILSFTISVHIMSLLYQLSTVVVDDTGLSSAQFNLIFTVGYPNATKCIDIPITSDTELEDDHDFNLTITSAGSAPHASIGTPSVATVTIEDDESMCEI